jgi:hypothetical protein
MSVTENVTICNTPKGTVKPHLLSSEVVTANNYNTFSTSVIQCSLNKFCESRLYEAKSSSVVSLSVAGIRNTSLKNSIFRICGNCLSTHVLPREHLQFHSNQYA